MSKQRIRPFSVGRAILAMLWASAMLVLPAPIAFAGFEQHVDLRNTNKNHFVLAQLSQRGSTTNSQIPRGPSSGGASSYGAIQPGVTPPKPGGTRPVGPTTRIPTRSGPAGSRFSIDNKERVKPKKSPSPTPKKTLTKRKPAKPKKAKVARPARPQIITPPPPARRPLPPHLPDQVVVLFRDQPPAVDEALANEYDLQLLETFAIGLLDGRIATYQQSSGQVLQAVIDQLVADPRVDAAQTENLYTTVQKAGSGKVSPQYALGKLGLDRAHAIAQGREVTIAVIDTGIDRSHPALGDVVRETFDAANDGTPEADDHGTGIAALIAGQGQVKGVAPGASLLAVRAFYLHPQYKRPVTSSSILLRAVDWAFANKARIFNMSFAGGFDPLLKEALTAASEKGVIHVAAAGNGGSKAPPAYPAAYDNVIAITALDQKDRLYSQANQGSYLTAAAPGVDVLVPTLKSGYRFSSGTSLAAAHVSGLVALLLERNPNADTDAIISAIRNSAHDLGPKGHDVQFGAGRADAYSSLLTILP